MQQLRERLQKLVEDSQPVTRRLIVLLLVFLLAVSSLLVALNSPKPYRAPKPAEAPNPEVSALINATAFVHIVGEVQQPGIYPLPSGSRLFDAIFAAGGFTNLADQASVNLAREISDAEQIVVLARGALVAQQSQAKAGLISLNQASQAELEQLPGVGPVLAARLVDWRTSNGGFKNIEDLQRISGIGQKMFEAIKPRVTL
jgi:competence protein ComEA